MLKIQSRDCRRVPPLSKAARPGPVEPISVGLRGGQVPARSAVDLAGLWDIVGQNLANHATPEMVHGFVSLGTVGA